MFESSFMRVALVASIATSAPLAVIGVYLIIRRVVFLGLVLANAAAVGAAVAQVVGWRPEQAWRLWRRSRPHSAWASFPHRVEHPRKPLSVGRTLRPHRPRC